LAAIFLPCCDKKAHAKAQRIKCINNLKNIGLAVGSYATGNNDLTPGAYFGSNKTDLATVNVADYFRVLSNELSTPKIILCPSDKNRQEAESFATLTSKNMSYFISLTAQIISPQAFLAGDRNLELTNMPAIRSGLFKRTRPTIPSGVFALTTNLPIAWSRDLHSELGNILMNDGSVQQLSNIRLKYSVRDQELSTNLLLIP